MRVCPCLSWMHSQFFLLTSILLINYVIDCFGLLITLFFRTIYPLFAKDLLLFTMTTPVITAIAARIFGHDRLSNPK